MKPFKHLVLAAALISLSACQTLDGIVADFDKLEIPSMTMSESDADQLVYDGTCPSIEVVNELRQLNEFTNPYDQVDHNLISRATITNIETACSHAKTNVTIDMKMAFEGMLGPRARRTANDKPFFSYPFFVAVTDAGGNILAKEIFAANMTYGAGQNRQTYYEKMRQIIPVENRAAANRFKILVGFQLDTDQLNYNRKKIKETEKPLNAPPLDLSIPEESKPKKITTTRF
ncbi:MAG: hypothetical protein CBB87_10935 [Micavibrio sp. TMED27]|nr:hypothetical protein [Micavibrio sp.]OUT90034.1 MAG: hypothetical protein CBB87_10935 [Micavibrio sp. TMED27]|tara:strand:+ start:382 stop:1074 length:693 start_codon:yes stop_codon:yes gene_type:complete